MTATAARMPLTAPRTLMRNARSQSSVVRLWMRPFGDEHAGVADQHVEAAEALDRQRDDGLDLRRCRSTSASTVSTAPPPSGRPSTVASSDAALTSLSTRSVSGSPAKLRATARAPSAPPAPVIDDAPSVVGHTSRYPPSTLSTVPVTNADASDARNWYAPARSVACAPAPLRGVPERRRPPSFGLFFHPSASGESNQPGRDDVHRDARRREVEREPLGQADEPGLRRAVRGEALARGRSPSTEPVKISRPPSPITRAAARAPRNAPVRFTSSTCAPDRRVGLERAGDDRRDPGVADPHVDAAPLGDGGVGDRLVERPRR